MAPTDTWAIIQGGYFKRFKGGALSRWVGNPNLREAMTLEERATLAFLTVSIPLSPAAPDQPGIDLREPQTCRPIGQYSHETIPNGVDRQRVWRSYIVWMYLHSLIFQPRRSVWSLHIAGKLAILVLDVFLER